MQLFGSLWIGQKDSQGNYLHKTKDQGKYIVLPISFGSMMEARVGIEV